MVVHQALKKPPALRIAALQAFVVSVVSVVNGTLREVSSAGKLANRGDFTSIHKTPPRQLMYATLEKLSGTCLRLRFLLWNFVLERMPLNPRYKGTWNGVGVVC